VVGKFPFQNLIQISQVKVPGGLIIEHTQRNRIYLCL